MKKVSDFPLAGGGDEGVCCGACVLDKLLLLLFSSQRRRTTTTMTPHSPSVISSMVSPFLSVSRSDKSLSKRFDLELTLLSTFPQLRTTQLTARVGR